MLNAKPTAQVVHLFLMEANVKTLNQLVNNIQVQL